MLGLMSERDGATPTEVLIAAAEKSFEAVLRDIRKAKPTPGAFDANAKLEEWDKNGRPPGMGVMEELFRDK